jgi:hypothetical protein
VISRRNVHPEAHCAGDGCLNPVRFGVVLALPSERHDLPGGASVTATDVITIGHACCREHLAGFLWATRHLGDLRTVDVIESPRGGWAPALTSPEGTDSP